MSSVEFTAVLCDECKEPLHWHHQTCRYCKVDVYKHRGQPPVCEECKGTGITLNRAHAFLDRVKVILADKNRQYGDSASNPVRIFSSADPVEQLKVRLDDKLSRIARGNAQAENEDVLVDIAGYLALLYAAKELKGGETP
jgi:hypothetical protein